jgi:hypothetical protein
VFFYFFPFIGDGKEGLVFFINRVIPVEPKMGWRIIIVIIFFFYRIIINISVNHDSLG